MLCSFGSFTKKPHSRKVNTGKDLQIICIAFWKFYKNSTHKKCMDTIILLVPYPSGIFFRQNWEYFYTKSVLNF